MVAGWLGGGWVDCTMVELLAPAPALRRYESYADLSRTMVELFAAAPPQRRWKTCATPQAHPHPPENLNGSSYSDGARIRAVGFPPLKLTVLI